MIIARDLTLSFGIQPVFDHISFTLQGNERIGLFGLNGAGKSTLLKAIAGHMQLDEGSISITKGFKVAYLPQEVTLASDKSIIDEAMSIFTQIVALQSKMVALELQLKEAPDNLELLNNYAIVCEELATLEPERQRAQAERMLMGLGFSATQLQQSVQTLSVGWKMRVVLAKLLLQKADFYLFDEPTNHLDIIAKEWFLRFLKSSSSGFMLVCHEKRFLNLLCTRILELERGISTLYSGNYDDYIVQKEETLERLRSAYHLQQREIERMKETIAQFRAKASKASMAQSMSKKLEKIEKIVLPPTLPKITFQFPNIERAARIVLQVKQVGCRFGEKNVFQNATFDVERGNKIAIVAANGVGKTTLLKIISNKLPLQNGSVEIGANVKSAVFDQDQTASLDMNATVLDNARSAAGGKSDQAVRSMLGAFLFGNTSVGKKASVLSGGERNRLGMVRILLSDANLLLLDEPTNHLDIPSKDMLLAALKAYTGTIIFVSHDQDFVNQLASHIIELTHQGTTLYHGDYDAYEYQKENALHPDAQDHSVLAAAKGKASTNAGDGDAAKRKQINILEQKIAKMEAQKDEIAMAFADLEYGTAAFEDTQKQFDALNKQLNILTKEWESLNRA